MVLVLLLVTVRSTSSCDVSGNEVEGPAFFEDNIPTPGFEFAALIAEVWSSDAAWPAEACVWAAAILGEVLHSESSAVSRI